MGRVVAGWLICLSIVENSLKLDPKYQHEQMLCLLLKRFLFVSSRTTRVLVLFLWKMCPGSIFCLTCVVNIIYILDAVRSHEGKRLGQ